MSIRTHKYKLYKTKKDKHIHDVINISGIIYNHCITLHKRYYRLYGKHLNKFQLQKHITKLKRRDRYAFWKKVPSQAIQNITERIDNGYQRFFDYIKKRKQGLKPTRVSPPTFKKIKKYRSYTLKGKTGYKINENTISLNGYKYKFWLSKPIDGIIKTVVIKRDNIGDFYICITQEINVSKKRTATGKIGGADFGLKTFLTLDNNTEIESPQYHLKHLTKIKRLNRNLSKKQKGSNGQKRAKRQLARLHSKIANARRDYFHKLSNEIAREYDYFCIEDLNLQAMKKLWGRKVSDLAFGEFVNILEYKTNVIKVDRFFPSSKTCSGCGYVLEELDLKTRKWTCPSCGAKHQRDLNAAINIKRVGASTLAGEVVRAA